MIDRIKKLISQAKGKTATEKRKDLEKRSESNALQKKKIDDEFKPLTTKIQELKKRYEGSSKAQQGVLKPELQQLLRRFNSLKRERNIYLENESGLAEAIGRMREIEAYKERGVDEDTFDDLAIELDEAAGDADGVTAAIRDLEKAGRRRNSINEGDDGFEDELAMFDEPEDGLDEELATFEEDAAQIENEEQAESTDPSPEDADEDSDDREKEKTTEA